MNDGNYIVFYVMIMLFHAVLSCKIKNNKYHSASIIMWQTYLSHLVASVTRIYFAKFRHTFCETSNENECKIKHIRFITARHFLHTERSEFKRVMNWKSITNIFNDVCQNLQIGIYLLYKFCMRLFVIISRHYFKT